MATLVFTAIGTLLGGPIGGAIGALVGHEVDGALFGGSGAEGPRLKTLSVTTSSYGSALPRHFGQMRVGGTVIWATELSEHKASSGGKGKPSVTTYSYSSSFAVALASRPLLGVGRVWADGNLLRGSAGDLKVGGAMRFYSGYGDQPTDPLTAGAEAAGHCPAYRGLAYVVFENLQLADYGNRIPTLSFEVFADNGALGLAQLFDGVLDGVDADVALPGILGFSCEGRLSETLAKFQPLLPMDCDAGGDVLTIAPARLQAAPIALSDPAVAEGKGDFGAKAGYTRHRAPLPEDPPRVLRYYDVALDYQPGTQRTPGQPLPGQRISGQPKVLDLPATLGSASAFRLIGRAASDGNWARETLAWRSATLDPAVTPGSIVTVADLPGRWRVSDWEWRGAGVELLLVRLAPTATPSDLYGNSGRGNLAADLLAGPTVLAAYEMPWDGSGSAAGVALYAAVSSTAAGWSGAALYVDQGDGALQPIGSSGRGRSTLGVAATVLPVASPSLFDRMSSVTVTLVSPDMALTNASPRQLAMGANRALLGGEFIQFGSAVALGAGQWRLGLLLRGRGGTEAAISGHAVGEAFVLLDTAPVALDAALVGSNGAARIAALGMGDAAAVEAPIACRGIGVKPLSPVHPVAAVPAAGGLILGWTRRARGAWAWLDGVDVALQEEQEAYVLSYGPADAPLAQWALGEPGLTLAAGDVASLRASLAGGAFIVRQRGTYALSDPLLVAVLS